MGAFSGMDHGNYSDIDYFILYLAGEVTQMSIDKLRKQVIDSELFISKDVLDDETDMCVEFEGSVEGIAAIMGKALCDIANTSNEMFRAMYFVCLAFLKEAEDTCDCSFAEQIV